MCIGLCFRDSGSKGKITSTAWENYFGTLPVQLQQSHPSHGQSGKSRVAPKTSKTTTAWWLVSKWHSMPLVMKCRIKNQKGRASPTQTWIALGKQLATYSLAASLFCTQSRSKLILHPASCWHSTLTPVRWAKPVWLRRRAKLPLHGRRRPTGRICHRPNVKSAMRKARSSPTQTWIACKECWLYNLASSFFAYNILLKTFYSLLARGCPKVAIIVQPHFL